MYIVSRNAWAKLKEKNYHCKKKYYYIHFFEWIKKKKDLKVFSFFCLLFPYYFFIYYYLSDHNPNKLYISHANKNTHRGAVEWRNLKFLVYASFSLFLIFLNSSNAFSLKNSYFPFCTSSRSLNSQSLRQIVDFFKSKASDL